MEGLKEDVSLDFAPGKALETFLIAMLSCCSHDCFMSKPTTVTTHRDYAKSYLLLSWTAEGAIAKI